jgi:raffinose/stachyose/melibiose transport system permease protein
MYKKKLYPKWFLIIPVGLYAIFFLLPCILGLLYSFTDWTSYSLGDIHFVGLQNYKEIFTSGDSYYTGILNTLKFTVISNILKLVPALFLAIMLQKGIKGLKLYRTILYLPSVVPYLVIGLIFTSILNYNHGLLNGILDFLHLSALKREWLADLGVVWKSVYAIDAWRGIGYCMTIFLAGLNAIPRTYYEAADIDGAGFFHKLRYITLPMLTGSITINLVFGLTYGLKVFDIIYVLTKGGPGHATEVATTYIYTLYSKGNYCMSVALNSVLFIITAVVGLLVNYYMTKKEVQQ